MKEKRGKRERTKEGRKEGVRRREKGKWGGRVGEKREKRKKGREQECKGATEDR